MRLKIRMSVKQFKNVVILTKVGIFFVIRKFKWGAKWRG